MKKNTTKPTKSPAPATKPEAAKSAAKTKAVSAPRSQAPAAKTTAPISAAKPTSAPAVVAKPAPAAPAPVAVKVAAVKAVERKPVTTTISARIDIGFGNALYIRGEGTGLSWDAGVAMDCVEDDLWSITLGQSPKGFAFKFLVNDLSWSVGPDYTAANGAAVTLTPAF
jgi:hypothetical protein